MIIILIILLLIGYQIGLYFWFEKAGEAGWKAFIPYFRITTWIKLTDKPKWFIIGSFIPVVNVFIYTHLLGETSDTYRRYSFWEHSLAIIAGFAWLPYLGKNKDEKYHGVSGEADGFKKPKKQRPREWADAIIFAIFAAYFIRTFVFEIYAIPTSSMEGTLRVGDVLVVSKFHYGSRVPNTPIAFPLVHHSFPAIFGGGKSYLEWIKLPYNRLPALQSVKRNDMVVFNFPANDITTKEFDSQFPYYDIVRMYQVRYGITEAKAIDAVENGLGFPDPELVANFANSIGVKKATNAVDNGFTILKRPVDKRENYIKRCVGIAGDKLQVKNGTLFINDAEAFQPENMQFTYWATVNGSTFSIEAFKELDITEYQPLENVANTYKIWTSGTKAAKLEQYAQVETVEKYIHNQETDFQGYDFTYYPYHKDFKSNVDNYGPITIPSKGMTIALNKANFLMYERCITTYENNTLEIKNGAAYLNGEMVTEYTFKMDYYWMMGDNRHRSQDSRYWGFVPEDHIVGKAWFLVTSFSKEKKFLRLNRTLRGIHGNWAPEEGVFTE